MLRRDDEKAFLRAIYWWTFSIRFGAGIVAWLLTQLMQLPFMEDASGYEELGHAMAEDWRNGYSSVWLQSAMESGQKAWFMVYVIAVFYFVTGGLRLLPVLIAFYAAITAWTPIFTYRICRELGTPLRVCRWATWLITVSPAFAFWSGALYKEGLVLLAINFGIYHALRLQVQWRWSSFLGVGACIFLLLGLRFYMAFMISLVLFMGIMLGRTPLGRRTDGASIAVRQIGVLLLFTVAMVAVGFSERLTRMLPEDLEAGLMRIQGSRNDLASYQSGYLGQVDISTPEKALVFLPVGTLYFLTVPWPWQFGSMRQNLAIPETAFWVLMYPLGVVGVLQAMRRNLQGTLVLVVAIAGISMFYGLFSSNVGVAFRMRTQVWLLMALFIAWGWHIFRQRKSQPMYRGWRQHNVRVGKRNAAFIRR